MKFFLVVLYQRIDKVCVKVLYLVHKIVLLEQLVFGGKKIMLIYLAFLLNLTAFSDIPVFVKYLLLGSDMFPLQLAHEGKNKGKGYIF